MDSQMPYFLVWSLCFKRLENHEVYCYPGLVSCPFMQFLYTLSNLLNFSFTCIYVHVRSLFPFDPNALARIGL